MTLTKRKCVPLCDAQDNASIDASIPSPAKRFCTAEGRASGLMPEACTQGWWNSLRGEDTVAQAPAWQSQGAMPPLESTDLRWNQAAGNMSGPVDMEVTEHPSEEQSPMPNTCPAEMSVIPPSEACARCLAGQPGHLLHIFDSRAPPCNANQVMESISFSSHFLPLSSTSFMA